MSSAVPEDRPHYIKARRRAKGSTIQGFYAVIPPPTDEQRRAVEKLIRTYGGLDEDEQQRCLDQLFGEPTTFTETANYLDDLERRRQRRRDRIARRREEAA
ncbi:hypothetical protein [Agromyces larvae]|uniref:DUF3263 domain-containing protein n=1 Tax=Agromyces larvae TaxID=2929802 RepID=A0ABY4C3M7_9MICO|nr:hypothetical protein [Agromyces larvae]UOE45963.1 hypothetical protein MTO99_09540 [Agromyces larvae]